MGIQRGDTKARGRDGLRSGVGLAFRYPPGALAVSGFPITSVRTDARTDIWTSFGRTNGRTDSFFAEIGQKRAKSGHFSHARTDAISGFLRPFAVQRASYFAVRLCPLSLSRAQFGRHPRPDLATFPYRVAP